MPPLWAPETTKPQLLNGITNRTNDSEWGNEKFVGANTKPAIGTEMIMISMWNMLGIEYLTKHDKWKGAMV